MDDRIKKIKTPEDCEKFARNAIESATDVFFLRFDDLEAAAEDPTSDLRALVAERRDQYEYWRNVAPPVTIGAFAPR